MRVKPPRTLYHPASPGVQSDDKIARDLPRFQGADAVVTANMDGESTTLCADGFHARALNAGYHPSRDQLSAFQFNAFSGSVIRWVRDVHVQSDSHWRAAPLVPDTLLTAPSGAPQ